MKKLLLCAAVLFAAACSKPGITVKISGFDETELTVAHMYLKDYPVPNDNDPRIKKQLVTLENGKAVITPDSLPSRSFSVWHFGQLQNVCWSSCPIMKLYSEFVSEVSARRFLIFLHNSAIISSLVRQSWL